MLVRILLLRKRTCGELELVAKRTYVETGARPTTPVTTRSSAAAGASLRCPYSEWASIDGNYAITSLRYEFDRVVIAHPSQARPLRVHWPHAPKALTVEVSPLVRSALSDHRLKVLSPPRPSRPSDAPSLWNAPRVRAQALSSSVPRGGLHHRTRSGVISAREVKPQSLFLLSCPSSEAATVYSQTSTQ